MRQKKYLILGISLIVLIASIIAIILLYQKAEPPIDTTSTYPEEKTISIDEIIDKDVTTTSEDTINQTDDNKKEILSRIEDTNELFIKEIEKTKEKNIESNEPSNKNNTNKQNDISDNPNNLEDPANKDNVEDVINIDSINAVKDNDLYIEKGFIFFYKNDFKYTKNMKSVLSKIAKQNKISFKSFNLDDPKDLKIISDYNLKYQEYLKNQEKFNETYKMLNNFFNKSDVLKGYQKEIELLLNKYGDIKSIKENQDDYAKYTSYLDKINTENHRLSDIVNKNILNIVDRIYKPTLNEEDKLSIVNSLNIIKTLQDLNEEEILEYVKLYVSSYDNNYLINTIPTDDFQINLIYKGKLSQSITHNTGNTVILTDEILKNKDLLEEELKFKWY